MTLVQSAHEFGNHLNLTFWSHKSPMLATLEFSSLYSHIILKITPILHF